MNTMLWHLFLAAVWASAIGDFSASSLLIGLVLAYGVLWLGRDVFASSDYCRRLPKSVNLLVYFLWKVLQANLRVAADVVTPRHHMRAGIIALPLDAKTDEEITLLAALITLTPGTLTLGVSEDRAVLFIHAMYIDDVEGEKRALKEGFERRLLEVLR